MKRTKSAAFIFSSMVIMSSPGLMCRQVWAGQTPQRGIEAEIGAFHESDLNAEDPLKKFVMSGELPIVPAVEECAAGDPSPEDTVAVTERTKAKIVAPLVTSAGYEPINYECRGMPLGYGFSPDYRYAQYQACYQCVNSSIGGRGCTFSCTMHQGGRTYPYFSGACN